MTTSRQIYLFLRGNRSRQMQRRSRSCWICRLAHYGPDDQSGERLITRTSGGIHVAMPRNCHRFYLPVVKRSIVIVTGSNGIKALEVFLIEPWNARISSQMAHRGGRRRHAKIFAWVKAAVKSCLYLMNKVTNATRSSAIAKSTARPSRFVGILYDISPEKICRWLINHFYVIGPESCRIRRNNAT